MIKPKKTDAVLKYLMDCALMCRVATYEEIANATELAPAGLGKDQLCFIRDACMHFGLPLLTVLCVQKNAQGQPGYGFIPADLQKHLQDPLAYVRAQKIACFAFNWAAVDMPAVLDDYEYASEEG